MRARELGLGVGDLIPGPVNAITDVAGVRVGMTTVVSGEPETGEPVVRTGATAILPHGGNVFRERVFAGVSTFNGYGELTGKLVIDEWGLLNSPILIVDTAHVGLGCDAVARWMTAADPLVGAVDVAIPVVTECDSGFLNDNRSRNDPYETMQSGTGGQHVAGKMRQVFDRFEVERAELFRIAESRQLDLVEAVRPAVKLYARLIGIHPFVDGNGRTGFCVLSHSLVRCGAIAVALPEDGAQSFHWCLGQGMRKDRAADHDPLAEWIVDRIKGSELAQ